MSSKIELQTIVKQVEGLASSEADGDLIILSVAQGKFYATQAVGKSIWEMLHQPISVDDVCRELMRKFAVSRETCEQDVIQFLAELEQEGLITVSGGAEKPKA